MAPESPRSHHLYPVIGKKKKKEEGPHPLLGELGQEMEHITSAHWLKNPVKWPLVMAREAGNVVKVSKEDEMDFYKQLATYLRIFIRNGR